MDSDRPAFGQQQRPQRMQQRLGEPDGVQGMRRPQRGQRDPEGGGPAEEEEQDSTAKPIWLQRQEHEV